jgi:hypothetical protein
VAPGRQIETVALPSQEDGQQGSRASHSLLAQIGNTPLLRLSRIGREFPNIEFYAKAE